MDFSFVILTWNSKRFISPCIESIVKNNEQLGSDIEIFIVDNGSIDGTVQTVKHFAERYPRYIKPVFLDRNMGTTVSRNIALKRAKGDTIVILDSDTRLLPDAVTGLMETLYSQNNIGLVAPCLIFPDGRYQKSVDIFPTIPHKIKRFMGLRRMEMREQRAHLPGRPIEVEYAISAFWMMPRETIGSVGILDENIFYSPEDVDYCLRIWQSGLKILYDPRWSVIHDAQEISRGLKFNKSTWLHIYGLFYYFRKHRYCLHSPKLIYRNA